MNPNPFDPFDSPLEWDFMMQRERRRLRREVEERMFGIKRKPKPPPITEADAPLAVAEAERIIREHQHGKS